MTAPSRYPRYAPTTTRAKADTLCVVCGRIAGRSVMVQTSFFRDDDEGPFAVCKTLAHPPQEVLDKGLSADTGLPR